MPDPQIEALLEFVKQRRGFDFTGYKRSTLERRIAKRMDAVGVTTPDAYRDYLEVNPDEFALLFDTMLINVTGFFRDDAAWEYLATDSIPQLLGAMPEDGPLRVWCAGCASGEETYTTALLLAEAVGLEAYSERVKLYATDIDDDALNSARHGAYSAKQIETVPTPLLDRYFDRTERGFSVRKDIRRNVIFGRNDLVQDAPISHIDLLVCRNTLMYFNTETQAQILNRLHFALNDHGLLFLGKSEMLITYSHLFRPVNQKRRIFGKVARPVMRDRLLAMIKPGLRDTAFDTGPVAQVVVDVGGALAFANRQARALFGVTLADVGRPFKDLELSYRPVELRSSIESACDERRTIAIPGVSVTPRTGETRDVDVVVAPLVSDDSVLGASVTFEDVTAQRRLQHELETSKADLETAYEELQASVEELETTNEELQSTNEELETTNEELQSTNEELETMNEELQSTNAELETINDELRQRTQELDEVNAFMETILMSMGGAVIVVDSNQAIQVWNSHATDMWGLRPEEVQGEHLFGLDIGLPVHRLKAGLRAALAGADARVETVLSAIDRRGRALECKVTILPLAISPDQITGAILLMERASLNSGDGEVPPVRERSAR
jgi:two-component system CheB/CheR fusion protein